MLTTNVFLLNHLQYDSGVDFYFQTLSHDIAIWEDVQKKVQLMVTMVSLPCRSRRAKTLMNKC